MIIRNFLTRALARRLDRWAQRYMREHAPDYIIGGAENPYLYRWRLRDKAGVRKARLWFNVYLHDIVRDDDDRAPHCHPWPSISIIIDGPLSEVRRVRGRDVERHFRDGDIIFRTPWAKHRLVLPDVLPARTVFIVGPRVKEWGFWCPNNRFVHWKKFTEGPEGERVGRGCD